METIYRVTDNTNQIYNIEFETVEAATRWINKNIHLLEILHTGFRPIRMRKGE